MIRQWKGKKIGRDWLIEDGNNVNVIATVNGNFLDETESDANAHLIAAAPEMYEALLDAQAYIARAEMKKGNVERTPLENKLVDVRTKAEGK